MKKQIFDWFWHFFHRIFNYCVSLFKLQSVVCSVVKSWSKTIDLEFELNDGKIRQTVIANFRSKANNLWKQLKERSKNYEQRGNSYRNIFKKLRIYRFNWKWFGEFFFFSKFVKFRKLKLEIRFQLHPGGIACGCNWFYALQLHSDGLLNDQITNYLNPGGSILNILRMDFGSRIYP